jgi:acyl-coenzyme A synthetase/AMP-(fatty) acid ligase/acyl carrier protein
MMGGDVVSAPHARRFVEAFPAVRLIHAYGPTENTTFSCCWTIPSVEAIGTRLPIGRPIANSTAYVVDDRLQPVAVGVPGELCVGGDGVALGYLDRDDVTAERFVPDPFAETADARVYRTGDRVRWRADGLLEFLGRTDRQVKIRGFRVELDEIETNLLGCSGVAEAAVVVAQTASDKMAFAFVVPANGAALDESALRTELGVRLPSYMLPGRIVVVPALPAHPSGKVDRVALAQTAESEACRTPAPVDSVAPGPAPRRPSSVQSAVADIWRAVLQVDVAPSPDTNFFDAGGDSLLLLKLQIQLSQQLDVSIAIVDLLEHTTIRALAAFISGNLKR